MKEIITSASTSANASVTYIGPTYEDGMPVFGLVRLDALVANVTGTEYLVKPYLERDCVGTVYGDSDTYKSFIELDFGLHIAAGIDYHGHKVHQCPVVYICGEGHGGIGRRVLAWLIKHNIQPGTIPFYVSTVPARLIEEGHALEIARVIKDTCPDTPGLIIIDTLSTNIGDGDESNNGDMARLITNVNLFIRKPTGACVPIVCHVGHGDKDRERGAYALRGNVEFRILVKREGVPDERRCTLYSLKMKDGPLFPPASFKANLVTLPGVFDSEGEQDSSLVMESIEYVPPKDRKTLPEKTDQCLVVLQDLHQSARHNLSEGGYAPDAARVESSTWRDECLRRKVITGKTQNSRTAQFRKIKADLKDAGLISVDKIFVFPVSDNEA